ncbi:ATP-binding protein [Streptomyces sp. NPDC057460]|uniref:ATP-binding protein n=1 Tax=Streptomyces sp. NPDC057460 TaxID=3346141 RepID=UPI0036B3369A
MNVARQQLGSLDLETIQDLEIKVDQIVQGSFPIPGARRDDAVLLFSRYEGIQPRPHRHIAKKGIQRRDLRGVAKAQDFVQSRMAAWGHEAVADDLILIVSELATNALIHADSDVEVRLREYGDRIRMEVRDSDPAPPVPSFLVTSGGENQIAEHGRGIIIVEALASVFGSSPNGRGKTIWLEIALP